MTDRVHPSSKPTPNGTTTAAAAAGANPSSVTAAAATNPTASKPQLRPPYRPQPQYPHHHHRRHRRSNRNICCCCCFWSILVVLALGLLAAIAAAAVYVLYHPTRPEFTVTSLRIAKLNLTTSPDSSSSRLTALLNLTVSSKNPNGHLTFFYDAFAVTASSSSVQIGNGSIPAFVSEKKNETTFRTIVASSSQDLDTDATTSLRSDLKKKGGVPLKIQMDTRVKVKMESLRSKRVGIRVTCQGIKAVAPKGKSPSVASVSDAKCKVDLRIKIWKWTF
ncbi:Late embryogenesis abundant protein [Parasponia andersonii]|uniref:Late embryogenesis abundant protein n=1 Tax=Parasponia andersonii TaxID=3476 RepID=A0A2P5C5N4_PARAD|nr:Late embryogenesis abundant protein [Parasponia andersonii]